MLSGELPPTSPILIVPGECQTLPTLPNPRSHIALSLSFTLTHNTHFSLVHPFSLTPPEQLPQHSPPLPGQRSTFGPNWLSGSAA